MTNNTAIENAEKVIERFGGIRPMAKKIEVAVTTVQGWKKRNVIPATRRELIVQAARDHNVDLSDLLEGATAAATQGPAEESGPANQNRQNENTAAMSFASVPPVAAPSAVPTSPSVLSSPAPQYSEIGADLDSKLQATEHRAVKKSTWINVFLMLLAIGSLVALLMPGTKRLNSLEGDVGQLRGDVDEVKAEQSFLSTLIPKDLDERIARLQQQAQQAQETIGSAIEKAGQISRDVLSGDSATVGERINKLSADVAEASGSPALADLVARFQSMQQSMEGNTTLNQAVSELSDIVASFNRQDAPGDIGTVLASAREQSPALGGAFEGVAPEDMKAAAMLLTMTQFRQSLNRDHTPFADDLQLLLNLVGPDDPKLVEALNRLAPKAEEGILTPQGVADQFKSMAGDAVVASLKGEDVSLEDRAKARVNELFQVEKDGELITGTPTQATLSKAQKLLDDGDLAGAVAEVQTLDGPAAEAAQPWLDQANAALMAEQLKSFMQQSMQAVASGRYIRDEQNGLDIMVPSRPFHGPAQP